MSRLDTPITPTQLKVYEYVVAFIEQNGYSPTVQQIADYLGVSSKATVQTHLVLLGGKGFLKGAGRSLRPGHRTP